MGGPSKEAATVFQKVLERNEKNPCSILGFVAAKEVLSSLKEAQAGAAKVVS